MTVKRLSGNWFGWHYSVRPVYLLIVGSAIVLCLFLSHWQWQRAQQAEARYQQYLTQAVQPPVTLDSHPKDYQYVITKGRINRLFLLDNQIHNGIVGWHVLAELRTDIGSVLVNLGWQSKQTSVPSLTDFASPIHISGPVKHPGTGLMLAPAQQDPTWPGVMQQIDIPLLNQHIGLDLAPFVIFADSSHADLMPVKLAPENKYPMHIGYAIQWLLIGLACLSGLWFACRRERL